VAGTEFAVQAGTRDRNHYPHQRVLLSLYEKEIRMNKSIPGLKRVFFYSTCALAFSTAGGLANAHVCMNKPYGQGYTQPNHHHHMPGHPGRMNPYRHPAYRHGAPMSGERYNRGDDKTTRYRQTQPSGDTLPLQAQEPDIVDTATAAGDLNTLIKAVVAADLYDTLRGEGPYTLFAPTDAAFDNLPDGMLDELLADKDMLVAVLNYHLVPGRLTSADLLQQREFRTVQGETLSINDLKVVNADNQTANGIVHVIENVVAPSL
jgi:uncharacterized surface protein with fasciclin (FAS1) repeats